MRTLALGSRRRNRLFSFFFGGVGVVILALLLVGVLDAIVNQTVMYKSWSAQQCVKIVQYTWDGEFERSCGWEATPITEVIWIE